MEQKPRDIEKLLHEVRTRTRDLVALLRAAPELGPGAGDALAAADADLGRRLTRDVHVFGVSGEMNARHGVLDAICGERVFAGIARDAPGIVRIAVGTEPTYEARLKNGTVERFKQSVPERDDTFAKAIARADRELADAEEDAKKARLDFERQQRRARTLIISEGYANSFDRFWQWLKSLFAPKPRPSVEDPGAALREADEAARARIDKATTRRAALAADRERYMVERRESFFSAIRGFADAFARGGEIAELLVALPTAALPEGITILHAPEIPEEADAILTVGGESAPPRGVRAGATLSEIREALLELWRSIPVIAGERIATIARQCIVQAANARAEAEDVVRGRIAALEAQRLADPAEFRARSLERMDKAIDDGARDVVRVASERLREPIDALKKEWRDRLMAAGDRDALDAILRELRETAPARVAAIADATNELVLVETQRASDSLQTWVIEEIHARYQVARRASIGEAAPVITEAPGEMAALEDDARALRESLDALDPFESFEKSRVGYGLGGAAAGAVLGTLVAPVIGTAIGAFLGVFAGLLKGIDSLKQECASKLDENLDECARQILAQLESRHTGLKAALRASLEDALDAAMARFEKSIARLMDLEKRTLETEHAKLTRLGELRAALEAHEEGLAALAPPAH